MFIKLLKVSLILLTVSACGPKVLNGVDIDPHLAFEVVKINPEVHKGKRMMVGGEIIEVRNLKESTEIDVLEKPLASDRSPLMIDLSRGRFLVVHPSFLDPDIFKVGRRLTVIATITGGRLQKIGEAEITIPIFETDKIHLWPVEKSYQQPYPHRHRPWWPDVNIGLGYYHGW